ncbi:MAG: hypothetical protein H6Q05_2330 [Acidobacteria bacterium]|nr:hypothetical protein [Acidobacteriota bacterium]
MNTVLLRFYEELNDHLPEDKRKRAFECRFEGAATVATLLHAVGIPLCEVDLILWNGESVDPGQQVRDGDRIAAYPVFESIDVQGVSRVRWEPLRRPRFVAGPGLQRLAARLRMLGFDTLSWPQEPAEDLVRLAEAEKRILLRTDNRQTRAVARALVLSGKVPRLQAAEVLQRLDLCRLIRLPGRCPRCNTRLRPEGRVFTCGSCGTSYRNSERLRRSLADIGALQARP